MYLVQNVRLGARLNISSQICPFYVFRIIVSLPYYLPAAYPPSASPFRHPRLLSAICVSFPPSAHPFRVHMARVPVKVIGHIVPVAAGAAARDSARKGKDALAWFKGTDI